MNQFHEASLDKQEDRELRRDMADPVWLEYDSVEILASCHIEVREYPADSQFFVTIKCPHCGDGSVHFGWGSCAAAAIREALKA